MTEVIQGLVSDAKKNKFSTIPTLTDEDVVSVWDNVSSFVEKQMSMQKGVHIAGLGTFTYVHKKLDVGNNKYILIQRPVFLLAEKFAQTHQLEATKHYTTGEIPVVQLNFAALSLETPFDRDTVEACVREVLGALSRAVGSRRNVEFTFNGIGKLQIRDSKVKMKFYKEFLTCMDGSGRLVDALKNRPGTADSVMSDRMTPTRPLTSNTLVLPRISPKGEGLNLEGDDTKKPSMPTIAEGADEEEKEHVEEEEGEQKDGEEMQEEEVKESRLSAPPSRGGSRLQAPVAKVTGVSLLEEFQPPVTPSKSPCTVKDGLSPPKSPHPPKTPPPSQMQMRTTGAPPEVQQVLAPPRTACSEHTGSGGDMCYLCYQRAARNVPVSFAEERRRKELEQDRLLQQYQHMRDTEAIAKEQEQMMANRHHNQKVAAFNLGVSEALKAKKAKREMNFHRGLASGPHGKNAYIFHTRPLTPPRLFKQEELARFLEGQVQHRKDMEKRAAEDQSFIEKLEQAQLAEDLARQRYLQMKEKSDQTKKYMEALDTQVRDMASLVPEIPMRHVSFRRPHFLEPLVFPGMEKTDSNQVDRQEEGDNQDEQDDKTSEMTGKKEDQKDNDEQDRQGKRVRFKPLPLPKAVSDSKKPIFGLNDMTNEKLAEQRRRAQNLYKEQLDAVAQRKREAILKHLTAQKEEGEMLARTRQDLLNDRAGRYATMYSMRKSLEDTWRGAVDMKKERDQEELLHRMAPGEMLLDQTEHYRRCKQCQRRPANCGESNVWSESRYIPGSRLMV
ncbi:PREDICTED: coiled-coil domain-containing protein 81-like isoform X1 [Branchiostoma belcheri]|uniref:Coiled-coil domain-containing protein 81-like isoform X1 n=1 Tax=Branchiostoma belcheri TaxID=7741 RepID=A0A6P4YFQ8_BRABE|nr:PREDICTED: coiled-coil domain-containing protein 81-like isoform X1 [Branchiostoma belcheri]